VKTKNLLGTVTLTVSTNPVVEDRLERLVSTGFYGKNSAEAAERIIAKALSVLDEQGAIPVRPAGGCEGA
jgi:hypothetical protein